MSLESTIFLTCTKKKPQSQCSPHRRSGFKTQIEILYEQLKKIDNLDFCFYKKTKETRETAQKTAEKMVHIKTQPSTKPTTTKKETEIHRPTRALFCLNQGMQCNAPAQEVT
jgi:hypothetical protein